MIILGSKGKKKVIKEGKFFCPHCRTERNCQHIKTGQYFSAYFIPLFKMKDIAEYVECKTCQTPYELSILNRSHAKTEFSDLIKIAELQLKAGVPLNEIKDRFESLGMDPSAAAEILYELSEGQVRFCRNCELMYSHKVNFCPVCGEKLASPQTDPAK